MSTERSGLEVSEIPAPLRANCPMQDKWISVKGKRNSCTFCRYKHKLRLTDWGAIIECLYRDGMAVHDFGSQSGTHDG